MWLQCGSEVGNCLSDLPSVSVNSHASSVTPGGGRRVADGSSNGRSESEELVRIYETGQTSYFSYFIRLILSCLSALTYQLLNELCFIRVSRTTKQ